jgi:hypothetical protein
MAAARAFTTFKGPVGLALTNSRRSLRSAAFRLSP